MGKIIYGSQWDVDNARAIGEYVAPNYTVLRPNEPKPVPVSSCNRAYFDALNKKYARAERCTRVITEQDVRARCAARYAAFAKKYPNYFSGVARLFSPTMSGEDVQRLIMSGGCTGRSMYGVSTPTSSRQTCSSCARTKKQKYNSKKAKSKKSAKRKSKKRN